MAAGDDEDDGGQRQLTILQNERFDVAGKMVDGDQRKAGGGGGGLGERHADEQRSDEPRPLRDRDRAEVGPRRSGLGERALDHSADVADVLPGRELRHDTAPLAMNRHLRGDDVGADRPWLRGVAGLFDNGGRRFVAGSFDTENTHGVRSAEAFALQSVDVRSAEAFASKVST